MEKQKSIGKSDAISKSIESLEKEIAKGQIASNLKPEEFEEFNKLQAQKADNESKSKLLDLTDSILQKVVKEVVASKVNLLGSGMEEPDFPTKGQIDRLFENVSESNLAIKDLRKQVEIDFEVLITNLKGGITKFRMTIFNNFKLPKNAQIGENRVRVTIGKDNNLEKIDIIKYTDAKTKKAVEGVFKMKEVGNWSSAKIYNVPVKTQFEISIFVVKN